MQPGQQPRQPAALLGLVLLQELLRVNVLGRKASEFPGIREHVIARHAVLCYQFVK